MSGPRRAPSTEAEAEALSSDRGTGRARRPRGTARDRALRLLSVRARSRKELETRLRRAGFADSEIEEALEGLARTGLIDDERFAQQVVEHAAGAKLAGRRVILGSLLSKGVSRATADDAMAGLAETEDQRAMDLAERYAGRLERLDPVTAYRRLFGLLTRRGFDSDVARAAVRAVLGEDGQASE